MINSFNLDLFGSVGVSGWMHTPWGRCFSDICQSRGFSNIQKIADKVLALEVDAESGVSSLTSSFSGSGSGLYTGTVSRDFLEPVDSGQRDCEILPLEGPLADPFRTGDPLRRDLGQQVSFIPVEIPDPGSRRVVSLGQALPVRRQFALAEGGISQRETSLTEAPVVLGSVEVIEAHPLVSRIQGQARVLRGSGRVGLQLPDVQNQRRRPGHGQRDGSVIAWEKTLRK